MFDDEWCRNLQLVPQLSTTAVEKTCSEWFPQSEEKAPTLASRRRGSRCWEPSLQTPPRLNWSRWGKPEESSEYCVARGWGRPDSGSYPESNWSVWFWDRRDTPSCASEVGQQQETCWPGRHDWTELSRWDTRGDRLPQRSGWRIRRIHHRANRQPLNLHRRKPIVKRQQICPNERIKWTAI